MFARGNARTNPVTSRVVLEGESSPPLTCPVSGLSARVAQVDRA